MALELELKGKVAIISGGSDGMGRAAAERLASEGVKVGICARRKDHLERAAEEIRKATGGEVLAVPADVSRAADVEAVVKAVADRWGGVDILLNNAGTSNANAFEAVDDATWQADFDLKVMGAVRFCRLAIPHMKRRGGGQIVNVTVVGGKAPSARALPTTLSRAAGINLTKSLANEYAADGIRVNTICIGLVRSAQIDRRAKDGDLEAHYAGLAKRVPLGRVAHAPGVRRPRGLPRLRTRLVHHGDGDQLRRRHVRGSLIGGGLDGPLRTSPKTGCAGTAGARTAALSRAKTLPRQRALTLPALSGSSRSRRRRACRARPAPGAR